MEQGPEESPSRARVMLSRERPFRLGAVQVRPSTREIVGPAGREVLEPRVMQVLVALAREGGEVVTRDDLVESCWEGRFVGEDAITRVISRLRRHTEGVGRDGWTLETVTKVGYRIVPLPGLAGSSGEAALMPRGAAANRRRLLGAGVGGIAAATSIAGLAYLTMRSRRTGRPDPEVEALYEKGREALRQGQPEPTAQAVGFLREVVARAPTYADGWGALARAYQHSLIFTPPDRQAGVMSQARSAAERALELNPRQGEAAATLALLVPVYRNWSAAEPLFLRARKLHPGEPSVEAGYSRVLFGLGRIKAAVAAAEASVKADAFIPPHRQALALALWGAGRTEEADKVLTDALALWPRHYSLWFLRFYILAYTGRAAEAARFVDDAGGWPLGILASDMALAADSVRALEGRDPAAVAAVLRRHIDLAPTGMGYAEIALRWCSTFGDLDAAFRIARAIYLGEGIRIAPQRYSPGQSRFAQVGDRSTHHLFLPPMAAMRADDRFRVLTRDVGLQAYWRASGRGPDDPAWARTPA